ncbi:MAG: hypothetical protein AABX33_08985 [Nanoarchaeota archaeon]
MKKALYLIVLLIVLIGCKESAKNEMPKTLSDLQVTACNKADEAKTCDTRLAEVGIVAKEDCCAYLRKCC